jgi:hypothetical protein
VLAKGAHLDEFWVGTILIPLENFEADPLGTDATRSKTGMRIDLVIQAGTVIGNTSLKKIVLKVM